MPELEVLIRELLAVDGLAAGAVAAGEVARLAHEVRDDAVEDAVLVAEGLARPADPLLAGAQRAEVLARLRGDVAVHAEDDAAERFASRRDVEEASGREGQIRGLVVALQEKLPRRRHALAEGHAHASTFTRDGIDLPRAVVLVARRGEGLGVDVGLLAFDTQGQVLSIHLERDVLALDRGRDRDVHDDVPDEPEAVLLPVVALHLGGIRECTSLWRDSRRPDRYFF